MGLCAGFTTVDTGCLDRLIRMVCHVVIPDIVVYLFHSTAFNSSYLYLRIRESRGTIWPLGSTQVKALEAVISAYTTWLTRWDPLSSARSRLWMLIHALASSPLTYPEAYVSIAESWPLYQLRRRPAILTFARTYQSLRLPNTTTPLRP